MKLKILSYKKNLVENALIGKTGLLRIKPAIAKKYNFDKMDKWLLGIDLDNSKNKNQFYIIKDNGIKTGKKCQSINGSFSLDVNPIIKELKIKVPKKCHIEKFENEEYDGFKLSFPNKLIN